MNSMETYVAEIDGRAIWDGRSTSHARTSGESATWTQSCGRVADMEHIAGQYEGLADPQTNRIAAELTSGRDGGHAKQASHEAEPFSRSHFGEVCVSSASQGTPPERRPYSPEGHPRTFATLRSFFPRVEPFRAPLRMARVARANFCHQVGFCGLRFTSEIQPSGKNEPH
jgi:hypothetical protein